MDIKELNQYLSIREELVAEESTRLQVAIEDWDASNFDELSCWSIVTRARELCDSGLNRIAYKLIGALKVRLIEKQDYFEICRLCETIRETMQHVVESDPRFEVVLILDNANALMKLGEFEESLRMSFDLCAKLKKDQSNIVVAVANLANISNCFFEAGDLLTAEFYAMDALNTSKLGEIDDQQLGTLYLNLAMLKNRLGKFKRAAMFLNKASKIFDSSSQSEQSIRMNLLSARLLLSKSNIEDAKLLIDRIGYSYENISPELGFEVAFLKTLLELRMNGSSGIMEHMNSLDVQRLGLQSPEYHLDYLKLLAEVREEQGEYKEALEAQKLIREIEQERFSGMEIGELHELRRKYDVKEVRKESFRIKHKYNSMLMKYLRQQSMISSVAHDLKGPLCGISNLAYYTSEMTEQRHTEKRNQYLNLISDTTKHLSDSVENLLGTRAMETGSVSVTPKYCECGPLMEYAREMYGIMAERKDITLRQVGSLDACLIYADKSALLEAVGNLVSNAIRYTQEGGTVEIISEFVDETHTATISVRDNGPGIPDAIRAKMYQKFARMSGEHDSSKVSLGLGLWIVHEIARNMKAKLTCDSAIGTGTTFSISMKARPLEVAV